MKTLSTTPAPRGQRGSAMIAALVVLAVVVTVFAAAAPAGRAAMQRVEAAKTRSNEKWIARGRAATGLDFFNERLRAAYDADVTAGRARLRDRILPAFDGSDVQPSASRPVIVATEGGGSQSSGCEAAQNGCTSILGNVETYLDARAHIISPAFFESSGLPAGTVGVADIRVAERRVMSRGGEAAYRVEYLMDARGGQNGRARERGEAVFGVSDVSCGTSVTRLIPEQTITRGQAATIQVNYTRTKQLVLSANGSTIETRSVQDSLNSQSATFTVAPASDTTYTIEATGTGTCSATTTHVVRVQAPVCPALQFFDATPSTIYGGGNVTVQWQVTDAFEVRLNGALVSASGSTTVAVSADTTFTLEARDLTNQCPFVQTRTVRVLPCPVLALFEADRTNITRGETTTLRWRVDNALPPGARVRLNGVDVSTSGTLVVTPDVTTDYTMTVESPGTPCPLITRTIRITVNDRPCPSITTFSPSLSTITEGNAVTVTWDVANAPAATTQIRLTGGGLDELVPAIGTRTVVLATPGTVTFTLTATSTLSECPTPASRSFNVTVAPRPVPCDIGIDAFDTTASSILRGSSATLSWSAHSNKPGAQVFLNGVAVAASGSQVVSPNVTMDYVLLIQNPSDASCTATQRTIRITVTDRPCPSITRFEPSLSAVVEGDTIIAFWDVLNAPAATTAVRLTGPGVTNLAVAASGSRAFTLSTAGTYTFTLNVSSTLSECSTPTSRTFTVTVSPPACNIGIDSMSVSSSCVAPGGSVTVTWSAHSNRSGTLVQINGAGSFPLSGSATFTVNAATNFTLSVGTAECGTFTQSRAVDVSQSAPTISSFSASNPSPAVGEPFDLLYSVSGAVSATINGTPVNPAGGSINVSIAGPTDFTLVTTSAGCSPQVSSRTIRVTPRACPVPSINFFRANPSSVAASGQTTFEWDIGNVEPGVLVSITGPGVNLTGLPSSGSVPATMPSGVGTHFFTITVANPCDAARTISQQVAVDVTCPAPQLTSFTVNPRTYTSGSRASITFNWTTTDPSGTGVTVEISSVGGGLPANGTVDAPAPVAAGTFNYTAIARSNCGGVSNPVTVTVTVTASPPKQSGWVLSNMVSLGGGIGTMGVVQSLRENLDGSIDVSESAFGFAVGNTIQVKYDLHLYKNGVEFFASNEVRFHDSTGSCAIFRVPAASVPPGPGVVDMRVVTTIFSSFSSDNVTVDSREPDNTKFPGDSPEACFAPPCINQRALRVDDWATQPSPQPGDACPFEPSP